ncbi:hypothetical protein JCM11641_003279 [Rhodosporidiobolus odoratus]
MTVQSTLLQLLPSSVSSFLIATNLISPLNSSLLLLLFLCIYRLIPSPAIAPQPWEVPTTHQAGEYNWRPSPTEGVGRKCEVWKQYTPTELAEFDGIKGDGTVLLAVRRKVYDVTAGKGFYGPGGPYASFAGRDASRGLANQSFESDMLYRLGQIDSEGNEGIDSLVEGMDDGKWRGLTEWEELFRGKYPVVGDLVPKH